MAQKHDQVSSDCKHFQPLENQSVLNHLHHKIHHVESNKFHKGGNLSSSGSGGSPPEDQARQGNR